MSWRVESRIVPDRWLDHDGESWTADGKTTDLLPALIRNSLPLTPTGPWYEPEGDDDPVGVFLCALALIPAPTVSGDPPPVPPIDADENPNIVH